jgi:hypothetical protein
LPQIRPPLYWDEDDHNIDHLWERHQVTTVEIEEMIFGIDGEEPNFLMVRDGDGYTIFGQTPDGRYLRLYGEFIESADSPYPLFRPVHSMDMDADEKRRFKERLK